MRPNASPSRRPGGWTDALIVLLLDVVLPLAVFYLARGLGAGPWLTLLLAVIAPAIGLLRGWWRSRQADPTALFVIAAPVLSIAMALITGDVRLLLARESWLTAATGGWIIISLAMTRPFLLDVTVQTSPPRDRARMEALWREHRPFRRWLQAAASPGAPRSSSTPCCGWYSPTPLHSTSYPSSPSRA